jgi:hypothetical protein
MDNLRLTSPAGSTIEIGSWLRADQAVDYGAHDLITQQYNQNAFVDGGQFSYEFAGLRKMSFPLIVPSGGVAGRSLDTIESLLRLYVRPNAYLDIQPDGVPSSEAVRFDIVGGRVSHDPYSVQLQRVGRRYLRLDLDTQPFGYWPTWITLASQQALPLPGRLALLGASVIGDIPGFARIVVRSQPTVLPSGPPGSYMTDFLAWSIGGRPSLAAMIHGNGFQFSQIGNGTYVIDGWATAIGGPTVFNLMFPPAASWTAFGPSPGYSALARIGPQASIAVGRHRVYVFANLGPSGAVPIQMTADAEEANYQPLASANPIATVIPAAASGVGSVSAWGNLASPAYTMYDMGEITWPRSANASGMVSPNNNSGNNQSLRLMFKAASSAATMTLTIAGAFLLPLEGPNGVLGQGFMQGSPGDIAQNQLFNIVQLQSDNRRVTRGDDFLRLYNVGSDLAPYDALFDYRGGYPYVGASDTWLNILSGARKLRYSATGPLIAGSIDYADVSVQYRPRFNFLKGI